MSHGCDSADFEAILGPMPKDGPGLEQHILFLLENPGMNYGNGRKVKFGGHEKQPPVCHYYFAPSTNFWPEGLEDFGGNLYGPYFAYLTQKHHLTNVYITNLVKCKYHTSKGDSARTPPDINRKCMDLFLRREINYFEPKLIVCFGRAAERGFKFAYREVYPIKYLYLYHPSYICDRWRTAQKAVGETTRKKCKRRSSRKTTIGSRGLSLSLLNLVISVTWRLPCANGHGHTPRQSLAPTRARDLTLPPGCS
jgi:hypothetical protein